MIFFGHSSFRLIIPSIVRGAILAKSWREFFYSAFPRSHWWRTRTRCWTRPSGSSWSTWWPWRCSRPRCPGSQVSDSYLVIGYCKDTIPKMRNKYSQKRNRTASVPISTFMCLWVIYRIFPQSVCLCCCRKICGPILGILIYKSQTHERGNWDWGRAIPFLGIHQRYLRCSAVNWRHVLRIQNSLNRIRILDRVPIQKVST